ncbi:MAG: acyl carrier protein [Methylotenera sp.]
MIVQTTTREDVTEFLLNVLAEEKKIDVSAIKLDDDLKNLDIDSFGFLEVIFSIEHQYNVPFPKNYEHIKTLQDVINVTYELIQQKSKAA